MYRVKIGGEDESGYSDKQISNRPAGPIYQEGKYVVSRETKYNLLRAKESLRESEYKTVYLTEDLTPLRLKLFQLIKNLNLPRIKLMFTREGVINCILQDESRILINSPDDLLKLGIDDFSWKELGLDSMDF